MGANDPSRRLLHPPAHLPVKKRRWNCTVREGHKISFDIIGQGIKDRDLNDVMRGMEGRRLNQYSLRTLARWDVKQWSMRRHGSADDLVAA